MGLNLKDLVVREKTTLESFASRIIAIDAYNALYQFLATIRGYDGAQLADSQGFESLTWRLFWLKITVYSF